MLLITKISRFSKKKKKKTATRRDISWFGLEILFSYHWGKLKRARASNTGGSNTGRRIIWNPIIDVFHRSPAYKISLTHPRRENIYTEVSASSRWRARYNRIEYRIFIFMHSRHSRIHRFRLHHPTNLLPLPRPILNRDNAYPLRTFAHKPGILLLTLHRRHERKCNFGQICRTLGRL